MLIRSLLTLLLLFTASFFIHAQESFPEKCLGTWEGTLYIYKAGQLKDSVQVNLEVERTGDPNAFTWVTTYASEQYPMVKDYIFRVQEPSSQTYIMDEGDDTALLMYGFDNKVYSLFETENTMLSSTYELKRDTLYFEVNSAGQQATGPVVTSFEIGYLQKAVFTRKNE